MRTPRKSRPTRLRVIAVPRRSAIHPLVVAAVVGSAVLLAMGRAWGATATKTATPPKAPAAPAVTAADASAPAPVATPWKSSLDPLKDGGWTLISDGPAENQSVVYASSHNIQHNGNVVTAWMRWEFSRPQAEVYPLRYQSAVTREELDCDARSYRRAAVFYYRRNNLQEKELSFTALDDDTTWKLAIPGTEADAMLSWGCKPAPVAHHPAAVADDAKADDKSDDKADGKADGKADKASTKAAAKGASGKKGAGAAADSSAPSGLPNSGGLDLKTNR